MNDTLCAAPGCSDQPFIEHPLPLCRHDALMVSLNVTDILHANALKGATSTELDVDRAAVASSAAWEKTSHPPVVYFLGNGDRVKIGTSTNITARVGTLSLRRSNALLLLQGGKALENSLHDHFETDRIGRTEWFVLSKRIREYIAQRLQADAATRQPVLPLEEEPAPATAGIHLPGKRPTADERILKALEDVSDPLGIEPIYKHKDEVSALSKVEGSTLDNALSRLAKADRIHRQTKDGKEVRGMYGLGAAQGPDYGDQ